MVLLFMGGCSSRSQNEQAKGNSEILNGQSEKQSASNSDQDAPEKIITKSPQIDSSDSNEKLNYTKPRELEIFIKRVQKDIETGNSKDLSRIVVYPIEVSGVTYKSAPSFQKLIIDDVLSEEDKQDIARTDTKNLTISSEGVRLGKGQIWVSESFESGASSPILRVISINSRSFK